MDSEAEFESLLEYDESRYPASFFADYEALACLAASELAETLLVRERKTEERRLAKCYLGENMSSGMTEATLLKKLRDPGIPQVLAEYQNDAMFCVVREYIEGLPLNEYVAQMRPSPEQSVAIASQICDILAYLHRQTPPIIHRDIKPQNIIIDSNEKAWLIDFGISREFNAAANKDTTCFGTVDFAPPEQYGFSQTDNRADIFSLGVLIGWLLTGESQPRRALPKLESTRFKKIVKTCTELAPDRRYATADRVKKALLHANGRLQRRVITAVCWLLVSVACLCAGFAVGRYTAYTPALLARAGVHFSEPLIEQAVRQSLQKTNGEPISKEDLLSVTELYIFGDHAVRNAEAFHEVQSHMILNDGTVKNGGIHSLEDLKQLKHLKFVHIALQDIVDLAPLAQLASLETVDLIHNPVEDVSPLSTLFSLRELSLYDSRVSDFSVLSACPLLRNIDAGNTRVVSLKAFSGISSLEQLNLRSTSLTSLDGIESLTGLELISFGVVRSHDIKALNSLPMLKKVYLSEDFRNDATRDLPDATFAIEYSD
jgi:serine/threonine protein kinase